MSYTLLIKADGALPEVMGQPIFHYWYGIFACVTFCDISKIIMVIERFF